MKLLLHICCAVCSIHPLERLTAQDGIAVTGFFYNPNIHPYLEYQNRRKALEEYSRTAGTTVIFPEYQPRDYFRKVVNIEDSSARCRVCWRNRLEKTALFAKTHNFDAFSTTLLISPYQDHGVIKGLCEDIAAGYGLKFLYEDFRTGFRHSQHEAREKNLYRQKYCGCIFSEMERYGKRQRGTDENRRQITEKSNI